MASPSEQWKHSHNELHHTYTNVVGKDNDLGYGIMRVDEDQRWHPFFLLQPFWNFVNACFFEYGIAAYDLELGRNLKIPKDKRSPEFKAAAKQVMRKIRKQATKDYLVHPALSIPTGSFAPHAGGELHRQRGPQPVEPLDHHVRPLPRGRRDVRAHVDRGRDPRRVVRPPDARLGQHLRLQGAARHERQPLPPDRAPPVPRPAEQPVRRGRSEGAGALREVRASTTAAARWSRRSTPHGTRWSGCRSRTAGWPPPTPRTCPASWSPSTRSATADKRKRRVMLKLLERKAKQPEYAAAA